MSGGCNCKCCEGPRVLTPLTVENPAGLTRLTYRVGTHPTFFASMLARLSDQRFLELAPLRTRERSDASIALLDAWALVGDVLTFYQERIAHEGFLRTATERRSVLELARLVGYALRPGVAASVHLAYTLEDQSEPVEIPEGARVNSVPGPGEQMEAFETSEKLQARSAFNAITPRLTQPQTAADIRRDGLYLKGTETDLKPNAPLLIDLGDGTGPRLVRAEQVSVDHDRKWTHVILPQTFSGSTPTLRGAPPPPPNLRAMVARLKHTDRFDVDAESATSQRVLPVLDALADAADLPPAEFLTHLEGETLPRLREEQRTAAKTRAVRLRRWLDAMLAEIAPLAAGRPAIAEAQAQKGGLPALIDSLQITPSKPPGSPRQLARTTDTVFSAHSDTHARLLTALQPALEADFYAAWKNIPVGAAQTIKVYALRVSAQPFGHNAPPLVIGLSRLKAPIFDEWTITQPLGPPEDDDDDNDEPEPISLVAVAAPEHHTPEVLLLDSEYEIVAGSEASPSYVVIDRIDNERPLIVSLNPGSVRQQSLAAYGLSGKTTRLALPEGSTWLTANSTFKAVRTTRVLGGSEPLELADAPIEDDVAGQEIELGDLYEQIEPGRSLIITGERADTPPGAGLRATELVMVASVEQRVKLAEPLATPPIGGTPPNEGEPPAVEPRVGEQVHSFLTLSTSLAYRYKRDTATIYGNIVKATHGETRTEILGNGDAARRFLQFPLKQPPLTYVSAPTPSGIANTLTVRVNDVQWHERESLNEAGPDDRVFVLRTDDDVKNAVVFGDGTHGARVPTGQTNVRAIYRSGIGQGGNVAAAQISLLSTRPLGVKAVINPIRASGGADRETAAQARTNVPLAAMALDRLVSVSDYADFTRRFAGIGKAVSTLLSDGRRRLVHVTIAGVDDVPIDETSDLFRNLGDAVRQFADPQLPATIAVRDRLALLIAARIKVDPDYEWETLEPKIRAAMLRAFGFELTGLGDDALASRAIAVMQGVPGVSYVDLDLFDAVTSDMVIAGLTDETRAAFTRRDRIQMETARLVAGRVLPAQLAYLVPDVPDTLILQEIPA